MASTHGIKNTYLLVETINEQHAVLKRAKEQLQYFLDRAQYEQARELFTEMLKTGKYPLESIWKTGVEIIGRTTPNDLADYLKAVYISSSENLALVTFNTYIDQLMLDENWNLAFEEMELVYPRHTFHHPIILRKMAICAYNQWKAAKQQLPESYFEDEEHDEYDFTITKYEKLIRPASKYLAKAHNVYTLDVPILDIYLTFLETVKERNKKEVVELSLKALKQNMDYSMLSYLLEINQADQYFKNKRYILYLYELNPLLKPDEKFMGYIQKTCKCIKRQKKKQTLNIDKLNKCEEDALRICRIFIAQVENNNADIEFIGFIRENLFQRAISHEICEAYQSSIAGQLLKFNFNDKTKKLAKKINEDIETYMKSSSEQSMSEQIEEEEEEDDDDDDNDDGDDEDDDEEEDEDEDEDESDDDNDEEDDEEGDDEEGDDDKGDDDKGDDDDQNNNSETSLFRKFLKDTSLGDN